MYFIFFKWKQNKVQWVWGKMVPSSVNFSVSLTLHSISSSFRRTGFSLSCLRKRINVSKLVPFIMSTMHTKKTIHLTVSREISCIFFFNFFLLFPVEIICASFCAFPLNPSFRSRENKKKLIYLKSTKCSTKKCSW